MRRPEIIAAAGLAALAIATALLPARAFLPGLAPAASLTPGPGSIPGAQRAAGYEFRWQECPIAGPPDWREAPCVTGGPPVLDEQERSRQAERTARGQRLRIGSDV